MFRVTPFKLKPYDKPVRLSKPTAIRYLAQWVYKELKKRDLTDPADVRSELRFLYRDIHDEIVDTVEALLHDLPEKKKEARGSGVPKILRECLNAVEGNEPSMWRDPTIFGDLWKDKIHRRYKLWNVVLGPDMLEEFEDALRDRLGDALKKVWIHTSTNDYSAWYNKMCSPGKLRPTTRSVCVLVDITKLKV